MSTWSLPRAFLLAFAFVVAVAAPSNAATKALKVSSTVGVSEVRATSLKVTVRVSTAAAARCTTTVAVKKTAFTLPAVTAKKSGHIRISWIAEAGAPRGKWRFATECKSGARRGARTVTATIKPPKGSATAALVAPGTIAFGDGTPTDGLHTESAELGKGAGGNPGYPGCCTWGAWNLAQWLGNRVSGNANQWAKTAAANGLSVGSAPAVGAVMVNTTGESDPSGRSGFGHVANVTAVRSSTTFEVTEMNGGSQWVNRAEGITNEFNKYAYGRVKSTGPNIRFIYPPGGTAPSGGGTNPPATPPVSSTPSNPSGGPTGVGTRLVADVNGDGLADAIVMFRDSGTAMVALAQPGGFGAPQAWSSGQSVGADRYFAGDVNGDGKADLAAFFAGQGVWKVSLSSGTGFWSPTDWAFGQGVGTSRQWIADATGDGKADMITFDAGSGDWYVSTSDGNGFYAPVRWIAGSGVGSTDQAVADANGDGKADALVWVDSNGKWNVGLSTGSAFGYPGDWSFGHGQGSTRRLVADVNGDGRADEAFFYAANGDWRVGTSSGGGFFTPTQWAFGQGVGTDEQFLADVTGDHKADLITFDRVNGDWYVSSSDGNGFYPPTRWATGHGARS